MIDVLVERGTRVVVSGLDQDFRGLPFGSMPELLCRAELVDKLQAVCHRCGGPATMTQRLVDGHPASADGATIVVGALDSYEARCRSCHELAEPRPSSKRDLSCRLDLRPAEASRSRARRPRRRDRVAPGRAPPARPTSVTGDTSITGPRTTTSTSSSAAVTQRRLDQRGDAALDRLDVGLRSSAPRR